MPETAPPAPHPYHLVLPSVQTMLQDLGELLPPHPQANLARAGLLLEQIRQALETLRLRAPSRLAQSMAATLKRPVPDASSAIKAVQLLRLARSDLRHHLAQLLHSPEDAPALSGQALFDTYRALERLTGQDSAHPIDLWYPQGQASLASLPPELAPPASAQGQAQGSVEQLRQQLDRAVLSWVKSADPADAQQLCQLCLQLAHTAPNAAWRSAWQLASAWVQALAYALLPANAYTKRLAARLLIQVAQQTKGQEQPQAQTLQELLFFCHLACQQQTAHQALPPLLHAIGQSCQLIAPTPAQASASASASTPAQASPIPAAPAAPPQAAPTAPAPQALDLTPHASLLQGPASRGRTPSSTSTLSALQATTQVATTLQLATQTWAQTQPEPGITDQALDPLLLLSEQLRRQAWEAGWAEVSTLADRLHRIWQRLPLLGNLPSALPQDCLHACAEQLRLLQQLAQGFDRRTRPEVLAPLNHWLQHLPVPPPPPEPAPPPAAAPEPAPAPEPQRPKPQNIEPLHFAVLEEEVQAQWPQLQAAFENWSTQTPPASAPAALLRALHTLKGSARLAGAHDWAAQVHALESQALEPAQSPTQLAQPIEALRLAFSALQQEMDLRHPQRQHNRSADPHGQPIDSLQRHALALLANHEQSLQHRQNSQSAMTELQSSLKGLRQLIQDCHVWADTLMLHGGLDMAEQTYEWHAEISDLVRYMLDATDDIGTIHRQLQHHQQEQQRSLQQHSGHLRALQHSLLYAKQRPFSSIAQRLQECLELAAQDCGKAAQLHISGGQLRLHKTTLQALVNALEHLLRNSLAHGIEPSRQRLAIGKPEQGQIQLRLSQQGSEQTIIVQDDGAGLNLAAIGQRARAQGMWHSERPPNAQEAAALVLQPGLSTAAALTAVAGRGIGLDAVQAQIQALGGRLRLQSKSGTGCRFTITLPAPPQVEQIIALRAGNWRVGIPAHYVQGQRSIAHDVLTSALEQGILRVDAGGPLPLYWAGALWQQSQHSQERAIEGQSNLLLLRSPTQRWGIVVDEVLSTQEVVLQAPGGLQTPIAGLLGTAIQPTGQVLQVYDPEAVIAAHEQRLRKGEPFQFQPNAATAAGQGQGAGNANAEESSTAPRPLIMLVDDSISVRRLAQHLLASHGWRVVTAANGLEALGLLETGLLPALLLVDIEMPDMNGLELLRRLREHPLWQGLPVVMLTAHEAGPVSQKALDSGAQAYLTKPYSPPQLLAQVARYAALAPQAPEAPEPVEAPAKQAEVVEMAEVVEVAEVPPVEPPQPSA